MVHRIVNLRPVMGSGVSAAAALYRSGALVAQPSQRAEIDALGLVAVYDLRTPREAAAMPDYLPEGARYRMLNVYGTEGLRGEMPSTPEASRDAMIDVYRRYVTGDYERAAYRDLFTGIASEPGPQLFHCTSGKDRTGWAAAILQLLAGLSTDLVMADFLLSNELVANDAAAMAALASLPTDQAAAIRPFTIVDAAYLEAGIDELDRHFAGVADYLVSGVGMSAADVETLAERLAGPHF